VRFLEAFADGREADMRERPPDMPLHVFIRLCVDDLKAMYYEARMAMRPESTGAELAQWFWGETAMGDLVRRVKARMEASEDPVMKASGYGIAR
jgi:hypothetical protein